jgi:hypothetical protein
MNADFRWISKFGSGIPSLSDSLFDFSGMIEGPVLNEIDLILSQR